MAEMRLLFNKPAYALGANGRMTWRQKAAAVEKVRRSAKLMTVSVRNSYLELEHFVPREYDITWYYTGVEQDVDNVVSRCKALLDGIADALKVNDRFWELGRVRRVKVRRADALAGKVEIVMKDELQYTKDVL